MERAIAHLANSDYDKIVELIDKETFIKDPIDAYLNRIYCKDAPLKTAVIWDESYLDMDR